jgi:UDPglucose--hexose-1-phosphate uridylyltransferase
MKTNKMGDFSLTDHPHRRYNPLTSEWVLNSPHRNQRPWLGKEEKASLIQLPEYDPECYLCPGNKRAGGADNPSYKGTHVFDNDFAALLDNDYDSPAPVHPLLKFEVPRGRCRVVCFSPRHDLTLPELEADEIKRVIDVWAEQVKDLGKTYKWVQVFENKGDLMGCSNPHPHCQIWAVNTLPNEPAKENRSQLNYHHEKGSNLLLDYQNLESQEGERIILENNHWLVVVPFWAVWPFESMILPKRHVLRLPDLTSQERTALADLLKKLLSRYDNLFKVSFPYSMGWHGAPLDGQDQQHWLLHAHIYPPLLRSATIRKFMVGFETMAEPQRDLTPEQAAARLRSLPELHFKKQL